MTHRGITTVIVLAAVATVATVAITFAPLAAAAPLHASAALAEGIARAGRAEATLRYGAAAPGGGTRVVHALLALEPPACARIDVPGTGEKIAARADGGEWLQPATRQMLRFKARDAAPALRWWRVLLATSAAGVREREAAPGRFIVTLLGERGAPEDSAEVMLDPHGLPSRLTVPAGDPDGAVYRLAGWRFGRARGEASFRLAAPKGFETVEMP